MPAGCPLVFWLSFSLDWRALPSRELVVLGLLLSFCGCTATDLALLGTVKELVCTVSLLWRRSLSRCTIGTINGPFTQHELLSHEGNGDDVKCLVFLCSVVCEHAD